MAKNKKKALSVLFTNHLLHELHLNIRFDQKVQPICSCFKQCNMLVAATSSQEVCLKHARTCFSGHFPTI